MPAETGLPAAELLGLCAQSAEPDGALAGSVRALAARKDRYGGPAARETLAALVRVCAGSRFLAQTLAARPRPVDLLGCARLPHEPVPLRTALCTDAVSHARRRRRHKPPEPLRLALRARSGACIPQ